MLLIEVGVNFNRPYMVPFATKQSMNDSGNVRCLRAVEVTSPKFIQGPSFLFCRCGQYSKPGFLRAPGIENDN